MQIWQKGLGKWERWWNIEIQVNTTQPCSQDDTGPCRIFAPQCDYTEEQCAAAIKVILDDVLRQLGERDGKSYL